MSIGSDRVLVGDPIEKETHMGQLIAEFSMSLDGYVAHPDDIMRNITGERVLGLPKEPQVDRDIPFREARAAAKS